MQVLTPLDFSRMVFSATGTPHVSSYTPQIHFQSPIMQPVQAPQIFQPQVLGPPPIEPPTPPNNVRKTRFSHPIKYPCR